jgi:hypothetical protein
MPRRKLAFAKLRWRSCGVGGIAGFAAPPPCEENLASTQLSCRSRYACGGTDFAASHPMRRQPGIHLHWKWDCSADGARCCPESQTKDVRIQNSARYGTSRVSVTDRPKTNQSWKRCSDLHVPAMPILSALLRTSTSTQVHRLTLRGPISTTHPPTHP